VVKRWVALDGGREWEKMRGGLNRVEKDAYHQGKRDGYL